MSNITFTMLKPDSIRNGNVVSEEDVNKLAYEYLTNRYEKKVLNDPDDPVREILIRKRNEIQNELDRTSPKIFFIALVTIIGWYIESPSYMQDAPFLRCFDNMFSSCDSVK